MTPRSGPRRSLRAARCAGGVLILLICVLLAPAGVSAPAIPAVVFTRDAGLWATTVDGSRIVRLTRLRETDDSLALSPDATMIAFARGRAGISTMRIDGSHRTVITRDTDSSPVWAPDGRTIYFVRSRKGRFASCGSIFAVSVTGQNPRRITNAFAKDRFGENHLDPAISPDGRRIAFTHWDACEGGTSSPRLDVVDLAGRRTEDLANLPRNGHYPDPEHASPAWSPDGKRLAFYRQSELTIANQDGSGERRVAPGGAYLFGAPPAWSPDGRWIAFAKALPDRVVLLVVHPDGTGLHRIARTGAIAGWLPNLPR